jgi:hypothetical protein
LARKSDKKVKKGKIVTFPIRLTDPIAALPGLETLAGRIFIATLTPHIDSFYRFN